MCSMEAAELLVDMCMHAQTHTLAHTDPCALVHARGHTHILKHSRVNLLTLCVRVCPVSTQECRKNEVLLMKMQSLQVQ